jgi:DNA-binding MarR family transcriptional regulator
MKTTAARTAGSGTAGSGTAGSGTAGSGTAGSGTAETSARLYLVLARLVRRLRREDPGPFGPGALSALATLADGPARLGDLAATEGVRAPTMSRIVDLLVAEGVAERVADPHDGRATLVRVTTSGAQMVAGARHARADHLTERLDRLSAKDLAALRAAMPALEALCD